MDTYIYITVVLILMVIIWACETAACMQWGRIIKQAYLELSRDLGESQITVPNAGGGTIWKRPPGWEIFNLVSLMDRDPLQITAELRLRLYAGSKSRFCDPNREWCMMRSTAPSNSPPPHHPNYSSGLTNSFRLPMEIQIQSQLLAKQ
jgi:hypothetical protein